MKKPPFGQITPLAILNTTTAGYDFHFSFNILPGDIDQSGGINILDTINVRNLQGSVLPNGSLVMPSAVITAAATPIVAESLVASTVNSMAISAPFDSGHHRRGFWPQY